MSQPVLTYSLNWGNNVNQKLSGKTFTNLEGQEIDCSKVTVTFSSSLPIKQFYATAVKDGKDYGFINDVLVDIRETNPTGVKLHDLRSRNANTNFSFDINYSNLTDGDGEYRIGLYTQTTDGTWNYEYFFITNDDKNVQFNNDDILQVSVITN